MLHAVNDDNRTDGIDDGYWASLDGEAGIGPAGGHQPRLVDVPSRWDAKESREPVVVDEASLFAELHDVFGYTTFRPGQQQVIDAALGARDCLAVMPTGSGKSLTYQLASRLVGGTTLVVSPLIALMKDQVDAATELGIAATFINSSIPYEERTERIEALKVSIPEGTVDGLVADAGSLSPAAVLAMLAE